MTDTKWTPGPWFSHILPIDNRWLIGADNVNVAGCANEPFGPADPIVCESNAHLIAAAPELYEALERCEQMVSTDYGPPDWDWIRKTLAKARGEEQ